MLNNFRHILIVWIIQQQLSLAFFQPSLTFYYQNNRRDGSSTTTTPSKLPRHSRSLLPESSEIYRPLDEARAESRLAHETECRRSEDLFFYHKMDVPGSAACMNHDKHAWESFSFLYNNTSSSYNDRENDAPLPISTVIDSTAPYLFTQKDLARVSKEKIFSVEECSKIIQEAEDEGQWRSAQSQASYAKNASTFYPIREHQLPQTKAWLDEKLETVIYPTIAQSLFSHIDVLSNPKKLRCSAASIVKYNATAGQTSLGLHRDGPLIAVTIPLNDVGQYDGGGTFIEALTFNENNNSQNQDQDDGHHDHGTLRRNTGHLILHPAMVRHAGETITRGLRYILVVWIFSIDFIALEHYSLIRANGYLAQALRISPSSGSLFRKDLLHAAINGYREALEFGSGNTTESAYIGYGQALLELRSSCLLEDTDQNNDNHKMMKDALDMFVIAISKAPSNMLACQMRGKALEILKKDKIDC